MSYVSKLFDVVEEINALFLVAILSFRIFDKTGNQLYWFPRQYHYPQTNTFRRKNKTHVALNLVQNWTS